MVKIEVLPYFGAWAHVLRDMKDDSIAIIMGGDDPVAIYQGEVLYADKLYFESRAEKRWLEETIGSKLNNVQLVSKSWLRKNMKLGEVAK